MVAQGRIADIAEIADIADIGKNHTRRHKHLLIPKE
jgi:hypothetical protein